MVAPQSAATAWFTAKNTLLDAGTYALAIARLIDSRSPGVVDAIEQHARSTDLKGTADEFAEILLEAIGSIGDETLMILDDYHVTASAGSVAHLAERIILDAPCRFMVLSRERPPWATPKRLFYGDVFEVGRSVLALDAEEATRLMPEAPTAVAQGLASLSEGWPAVIALAARLPVLTAPDATLPADLHEFFAEELFNTLDADS